MSSAASAETYYFIDGNQVSKGQATIKSLQEPGTEILQVRVQYVRASQKTASLRKLADAPIKDIPNCN